MPFYGTNDNSLSRNSEGPCLCDVLQGDILNVDRTIAVADPCPNLFDCYGQYFGRHDAGSSELQAGCLERFSVKSDGSTCGLADLNVARFARRIRPRGSKGSKKQFGGIAPQIIQNHVVACTRVMGKHLISASGRLRSMMSLASESSSD